MSVEIREVAPGELPQFGRTSIGFWGEAPDAGSAAATEVLDRPILALVDGEDAGTAGTIDFRITLPGGAEVAMDGVTWVVVSATQRRRGVLRAMMDDMLEHARARGVPLLGLGASESLIYRRFGYGVASHIATAEIDTAHAALRVAAHDTGRVRMQPLDSALDVWMAVDAAERGRVARVNRPAASWRRMTATAPTAMGDLGPLQVAVHVNAAGVVDGFVNYRLEYRWPGEVADGVVHVRELSAQTLDAHVALWQHVLQMDLMEHLRIERFWLDDPIQHLLSDRRRLRVHPRDDLHLRVVDVAAVLGTRRYSREDALVVEVDDAAAPDIAGRYAVEGGLDGATASCTDRAPDIVVDAPTLGSMVLGDVTVAALHRAGLVDERRDGAVQRASAMFSWSPRPWLTYMF